MVQGPMLLVILVAAIAFIIFMTAKINLHAFLVLLLASFGVGILSGMPLIEVVNTVTSGFGGILSYIGILTSSPPVPIVTNEDSLKKLSPKLSFVLCNDSFGIRPSRP